LSRRLRIALLAVSALCLGLSAPASAAVTVSNTNDSGPGSLRQAIADAPPGETIELPAGTYTLASGPLEIEKSLTILGHDDADTKVSGGGASKVFEKFGAGDVTMSGITISDGLDDEGENAGGGGILSLGGNLTLRGVTISDNHADADAPPGFEAGYSNGGGILFAGGKLVMIDCVVTRNTVSAVGGAGKNGSYAEGGGLYVSGGLEIVNTAIEGNTADARGGQGPSSAEQDGGGAVGAGLLAVQNSPGPTSTIIGSSIANNLADASAGPGGGAGNVAGGGIVEVANDAPFRISNSTIAANVSRATGTGKGSIYGSGADFHGGDPGTVTVLATTIGGNSAALGAESVLFGRNLLAEKLVSIGNTIVADPLAGPTGPGNCYSDGTITSLGFNIDGGDECGFHVIGDLFNTDPQLGPLQDNGGPTLTMAPAATSPAVDRGSALDLATDQRGVIRPIDFPTIVNAPEGNGADIGAVELQPSNSLVVSKPKKNKKKGTAKVTVTLPQPAVGSLVLSGGKAIRGRTVSIDGQKTKLVFSIKAKGKAKKKLRRKGKRKVALTFTYSPTGNAPASKKLKLKLVKKKPGKKRKKK